jgi:hypothetical protein
MRRFTIAILIAACLWACNSPSENESGGNGSGISGTFTYEADISEAGLQAGIDIVIDYDPCSPVFRNFATYNSSSSTPPAPPTNAVILADYPEVCADTTGAVDTLYLLYTEIMTQTPANACASLSQTDYDHIYTIVTADNYEYSTSSSTGTSTCRNVPYNYSTYTTREPQRKILVAADVEDTTYSEIVFHNVPAENLAENSEVGVQYQPPGYSTEWFSVSHANFTVNTLSKSVKLHVEHPVDSNGPTYPGNRYIPRVGERVRVTVFNE